jgi:hypothetical protein
MKLTKTDIVEYIVAFIGIVVVLAYINATAEPHQTVAAAQVSPKVIEPWTIRTDAGRPAGRFRDAMYIDMRV